MANEWVYDLRFEDFRKYGLPEYTLESLQDNGINTIKDFVHYLSDKERYRPISTSDMWAILYALFSGFFQGEYGDRLDWGNHK